MAKSRKQIYSEKKRQAVKKAKITRELNKFVKENREQILQKGKEDLGNISDEKVIDIFKANFRERQEESLSITKAKQEMKKTLHTETFTGRDVIDYENVMKSMDKEGRHDFRKLRGWNEKLDYSKFKRVQVPPGEINIRARYEYDGLHGKIILSLVYNLDGSYNWIMRLETNE